MADYFVITGGDDGAAGTSFSVGFATIKKGMDTIAAGSTGDRLFVDYNVKEDYTTAGDITWGAGTLVTPAICISCDSTTSSTSGTDGDAFDYTPMAQTQTSNVYDAGFTLNHASHLYFDGWWVIRGINFRSGDQMHPVMDGHSCVFEDCSIGSDKATSDCLDIPDKSVLTLNNVSLYFSSTSAGISLNGGGFFIMNGGGVHADTANVSRMFEALDTDGGTIHCYNADFTEFGDDINILGSNASKGQLDVLFSGCRFPTNATFDDGTHLAEYSIRLYACAFGTDNTIGEYYEASPRGTTVDSTTTYGDATFDGTTGYSLVMSPSTVSIESSNPLRTLLGNMSLGAGDVVNVRVTCDTQLDNSQFWIDVHAPDATYAGFTNIQTTKGEVAAATTLTEDMGSPFTMAKTYKQKVTLTLTDNQLGNCLIFANAAVSSGNVDIYVDPEPSIG
jgi:hypothetical protein